MPQWDFLNFIAEQANCYPQFRLMMQTEATGLLEDSGRVVGLRANSPDGPCEIRADLVVGADGRHSTLRASGGFTVDEFGSPIDVLWMRISRRAGDPENGLGNIRAGRVFVMLDRGDYWQCALVIAKGGFDAVHERGLEALRTAIAEVAPVVADRLAEIGSWDDVKLLTVAVNRVRRWYRPGLLLIGDAAHAMSPIGGVGINLAIQDAVATANILAGPLRQSGAIGIDLLRQVQRRREWPMRVIQRVQITAQNRIIGRVLSATGPQRVPAALRLLQRFPYLRRYPARLLGLGIRPEHVRTA